MWNKLMYTQKGSRAGLKSWFLFFILIHLFAYVVGPGEHLCLRSFLKCKNKKVLRERKCKKSDYNYYVTDYWWLQFHCMIGLFQVCLITFKWKWKLRFCFSFCIVIAKINLRMFVKLESLKCIFKCDFVHNLKFCITKVTIFLRIMYITASIIWYILLHL